MEAFYYLFSVYYILFLSFSHFFFSFVLKIYFLVYHFNSLGAPCIIFVIVAIFLMGHYN